MRIAWWWGIFVCLLAGCSTNPIADAQHHQELLFGAERSPSLTPMLTDAYNKAVITALGAPTTENKKALVDLGNARTASACNDFLYDKAIKDQTLTVTDKTLAVINGGAMTFAGIFNLAASTIAGAGAVLTGWAGLRDVAKTTFLSVADYGVQSTITRMVNTCAGALKLAAPTMTVGEAVAGGKACERVCTIAAGQAAATQAITAVPLDVDHTTGAVTVAPK